MNSLEDYLEIMRKNIAEKRNLSDVSLNEISRRQAIHISKIFGSAPIENRTEIQVRINSTHLNQNHAEVETVTDLVRKIADLVKVCGQKVASIKKEVKIYFLPEVRIGSTVITLFGESVGNSEIQGIIDESLLISDLDFAVGKMFDVFNQLENLSSRETVNIQLLDGEIGIKLFQFSKAVVDQQCDVDIKWLDIVGRNKHRNIDFEFASDIKNLLDIPIVEKKFRQETVIIESIDGNGKFVAKLIEDGRRKVESSVPLSRLEELRTFWLKKVILDFEQTVISHPQRDDKKIQNEFIDFKLVDDQMELF